MKQRNVLLVIQPAYPERIQGIARFARSHGWHLTIADLTFNHPEIKLPRVSGDHEALPTVPAHWVLSNLVAADEIDNTTTDKPDEGPSPHSAATATQATSRTPSAPKPA